jgi:NAD(P)-dependent dehydrogenase (short-subunit alcohol dehydrogenase family)
MRVLVFGAGGLSAALDRALPHEVIELSQSAVDVRDIVDIHDAIQRYSPGFIINAAGRSELIGDTLHEIIAVNLTGAINVAISSRSSKIPCLLVASTAGMQASEHHPWYGPAKAGVIAHVRAVALAGQEVWALSPNRMETKMRQADWPDEDPKSRLDPERDVAPVVGDIIAGRYAPGANVVVRKVGISGRVDVFQAPTVSYEGML